jgi:hypothetical protein
MPTGEGRGQARCSDAPCGRQVWASKSVGREGNLVVLVIPTVGDASDLRPYRIFPRKTQA